MILLWVILAIVSAAAVLAVVAPMLSQRGGANVVRSSEADVFRDQLEELDRDIARGIVSEAEAEPARIEVSRRLIQAAEADDAARADAPRRLRLSRAGFAAAAIGIPAVSLSLYLALGSPNLPGSTNSTRLDKPVEQASVQSLVGRIEAQLSQQPDDVRGWRVLAPVYRRLGRFRDAARAYRRVIALDGRTPELVADYAEALVLAEQGLVRAEARKLFAEADEADPELAKPDFYLGLAAEQEGNVETAIKRWEALLARGAEDAPWRAMVSQRLAAISGQAETGDTAETRAPALSDEQVAATSDMTQDQRREFIESMIGRLATRLEADGSDLDGWLRLARARSVLGRRDEAAAALNSARQAFADDKGALNRIEAMRASLGLAESGKDG